jgi:gliding motility-associated-like protein
MDATETPGACWEYCWSIDADFGTFANSLTNTMTAPLGGNSMIPGSYEPLGDFSDFEGSPANGTWTLTITDNLAIDNGFICGWGLSMNVVGEDDEIIADTLVAEILTYNWYCAEEPSSIVDYDSTMVVVQPTTAGIHTYVMTITDSYGCEYTEEFEVDVYSSPVAAPNGVSECQENFDLAVTNVPPGGGSWQWVEGPDSSSVSFDPDTNSFTPEITVSEIGEYTFVFTDLDCGLSDEMTVDFEVVNPIINPVLDVTCLLDNTISVIDPTGNGGEWTVVAPDTSMLATLVDSSLLQTGISVNEFGTYQVAFTVDFCFGIDSMDVNFITVDPYIFNPGVQVCDWEVDVEVDNPSTTGGLWEMISQPNHTTAEMSALNQDFLDIEVDDFGGYEMVYTIAGCETSDTLTVQFGQAIPQLSLEELMRCDLSTDMEVETHGMEEGWIFIDGPDTAIFTNPFANETDLIATQYGDYTFGYTGCDTTMVFNILFMCDLTIPNVFSPNGDNLNDYLTVEGLTDEFYSYSNMSVYNRWGDEVYRNGHYGLDNSWWDGQSTHQNEELSDGVYFYILKVGNKVTDEEDVYRGTIHLLN